MANATMAHDVSNPLANTKHEKLAQLLATGGLTTIECYKKAGYIGDKRSAQRGANRVRSRMEYLQTLVADKVVDAMARDGIKAVATREWVRDRLMKNARIALGEEARILRRKDPKTKKVTKQEIWDTNASAANRALQLLGTELGMFEPDVKVPPPPEALTAARTAKDPRIANQLTRYQGGKPLLQLVTTKITG